MIKKQIKDFVTPPKYHIASLDFLRATAIILVFLTHSATIFTSSGGNYLNLFRLPFIQGGWIGVELFFVLSGYLIGFQLWKQYVHNFTFNFKEFIIKRTFRIWPLYFTIGIIFLLVRGTLHPGSLYSDFYFLSNYISEDIIKGSWSLSVEEQFYIILPISLLILGKLKISMSSWRIILISLLIFAPGVRYFVVMAKFGTLSISITEIIKNLYFPIHTNYDALIFGLLLSNIKLSVDSKNNKSILYALISITLLTLGLRVANKVIFNYSFLASLFATSTWYCLHHKNLLLEKFFKIRIFHIIAKLSFGTYLLHYQLITWLMPFSVSVLNGHNMAFVFFISLLLSLFVTLSIAYILYQMIESPSLRLRNRYLSKV